MKKIVLSLLAGVIALSATLGTTTSCDKVEHSKELTELWVLIVECGLYHEADYTPETWAPFKTALTAAEKVAASHAPTLEAINTAITNLHKAIGALVAKPQPLSAFCPEAGTPLGRAA